MTMPTDPHFQSQRDCVLWVGIPLGFSVGLAAVLALAMLLTSGCKPKATAPNVLARVGSREIRVEDFKKEVEWRIKNQRPLPDKQSLLEEMISRELLLQKARAAGLEDDPDVRHSYESLLAGKLRERLLTPRIDALKVSSEEVQARYEKTVSQNT